MSKVRVYKLAEKLGVSSKKLLGILQELDINVSNHMSTLDEETVELVKEYVHEEREKENQPDTKSSKADNKISLPKKISVKELAEELGVEASQILKHLMNLGVMANINKEINFDTAELIAEEFGFKVKKQEDADEPQEEPDVVHCDEVDSQNLKPRPPIVTVMGHVDHGKTSLLDAIRQANITAQEAGGITQHIGAYQVEIEGKKIVFIDTPGHEAFTTLRARGAKVTDIAVLVVAADDGVMPQTIEAINHAKAANIPIIVAINKIDKNNANPEMVKQQLTEHGLVPEEWGGDTICVAVSALKKEGLDTLLEMILLLAEMQELKADPDRPAVGTIIEAKLDKGRGPVATVIVQKGTLHVGDPIVAGTAYGKVRAMIDDKGRRIKKAGPSTPVEVLGLSDVPNAGDLLYKVTDEKEARQIAEKRKEKQRESELQKTSQKVSLDELFNKIKEGQKVDLNIIIKADTQGSVEALKQALEKLSNKEIEVKVIHGGVGAVTETDIMLAAASNAIIIGFNVRPEANAKKVAEKEKVDVRTYRVIYEAIDDVKAAMKGMLEPEYREKVIGRLEVRATFKVPGVGVVAGCYVLEGKVTRKSKIRVLRDSVIVHEGAIASLKRFKDDVGEVSEGYECGVGIENFNDVKEGDILEAYIMEEVERS